MQKYKALIFSLAIISLFIFFINTFDWSNSNRQEIFYSDFLTLVESDKVARVEIQGGRVNGSLKDGRLFYTLIPKESAMVEKLLGRGVQVEAKDPEESPWYVYLLVNWGPFLLLIGVWIYFLTKMPSGGAGKIFSVGKSRARKIQPEKISVNFSDVAGADECKADLEEIVHFLRDPNRFHEIGAKIPKGVLMIGPPGTGKTLLAKALAGEAGVSFFSVSGSDFVEMFVGVGASRVRDLFQEASRSSPCIIFIDEIDAVGRHRGAGLGGGHDEREQTLNQMLVEMDGFDSRFGVIVVAATNRIDILDPALLRPGRFDRHVNVSLPDMAGREAILKVHASPEKIKLAEGVDLSVIARGTPGFSGAQLASLCNEAALHAARIDKKEIDLESLEWARDKVMMGAERKSMIMTEEEKLNTAYHEAGHALVAAHVKDADPIHKITIIPRGGSLGLTAFLPKNDQVSFNKDAILSKITISMGGRAAEKVAFDSRSSGAEGDLKSATDLAFKMVCKWGMSAKLGALAVKHNESGNFLAMDYFNDRTISDNMLKIVDEEVRNIVSGAYEKAEAILRENVETLHRLAKKLIEKETLTGDEFYDFVGKHSGVVPE